MPDQNALCMTQCLYADGQISAVQVLTATAMCGIIQAGPQLLHVMRL